MASSMEVEGDFTSTDTTHDFIEALLRSNQLSTRQIATLTQVCSAWRACLLQLLREGIQQQHPSEDEPLIVSMCRYYSQMNQSQGTMQLETLHDAKEGPYCAAWFRPEGIQTQWITPPLTFTDEDAYYFHQHHHSKQTTPEAQLPLRVLEEWQSLRTARQVLEPFGFASDFITELFPSDHVAVVRSATLARPEGYCLCQTRPERVGRKQDDDDDIDDYREHAETIQQRHLDLQREVLPRVIQAKDRPPAVQFLNASGRHAVCLVTPPFAEPLQEPVTIFCVGIATEDGCFLSGLHRRFELGHLYPADEVRERTERSAIALVTSGVPPPKSPHRSNSTVSRESSNQSILRFSSDDNDGAAHMVQSSDTEECDSWMGDGDEPPCSCVFQDVGPKVEQAEREDDNLNRVDAQRIRRGRHGPGRWHCYTAVYDGPNSRIRVDGREEAMQASEDEPMNGNYVKGILDGLTLGSDHCFGVSLCCGQQTPPSGEGAIAEVAVFSGRLHEDDMACIEDAMMKRHRLERSADANDDELMRRSDSLILLWPRVGKTDEIYQTNIPLRFLTRHRNVSWAQTHPVTGDKVSIQRIGTRNSGSTSEW